MRLYIRNMVCNRCKMAVADILHKAGLQVLHADLGEVEIAEKKLSKEVLKNLQAALEAVGFEIIDDKKSKVIEGVKTAVIDIIHHTSEPIAIKYSDHLSTKLQHDYSYLSKLFSEVEGITIEQYIINQKIERVKELLVYDELSLSEVSYQMGYSSVAHLSAQFKKVTGMTPTVFKNSSKRERKPLDNIGGHTA